MKVEIPAYRRLFAAITTTHVLSSTDARNQRRIYKFLDEVLPKVREGILSGQEKVCGNFNFSVDADIQSSVTRVMKDHGYRFHIRVNSGGKYEWEVEIYLPGSIT